jgi:hydrogenase maturation protease
MDAHSMNPAVVLGMLTAMGGRVSRVVVVGCAPSVVEEGIGLSPPVLAAVDRGVEVVHDVIADLLAELSPVPDERSPV